MLHWGAGSFKQENASKPYVSAENVTYSVTPQLSVRKWRFYNVISHLGPENIWFKMQGYFPVLRGTFWHQKENNGSLIKVNNSLDF